MHLAEKCGGGVNLWGMISDPVGEMIKMVAKLVMRGAFAVFKAMGGIGSQDQATSAQITLQTQWIVVYLAVGSILFAAIKMALDRRAETGQTALKGILRVVLISSAASTVIDTFVTLMDRYSAHLLAGSLEMLLGGIDCSGGVPNMLLLVIGVLLLISAIIHTLLMWIRLGVMIILMGTLPMAAAASMTDWGSTWWRKHVGWMIAWLLYKPTVSLVIWSGAAMVHATTTANGASKVNTQIHTQIAGMGTLLLSAVALPALLRLIVPAMAALGADSAGAATMGVAGGVASGAKSAAQMGGKAITDRMSGGSGASGDKGSSPSGASGGSSGGSTSPGRQRAATAARLGIAGVIGAATVAGKAAKGAVDVAKSGVEGGPDGNG
ncbi:hypothetical protein [Streptomyces sp. NRRL S-813]|uniref:hypothetical protein n=1 Tax=Streptomyces sp. NRRL S-813 TaxID=1463919 RepID=UPI00068F1638|nr:hypothetical protein [Streptomyces sp. NRRL S-813]